MSITNLSETEIIELQYSLLEELKNKTTNQEVPISFDSNEGIDVILTQAFNGETKSEKMSARVKPSAKQLIDSSDYSCADAIEYFAWVLNKGGRGLQNTSEYVDEINSGQGITRNSPEYSKYREKVLKRDGVCQCCGSKNILEVHHLLPYKQYVSLRADVNNGIVLCKYCHDAYHNKHGYKRNANPITLARFLRDYDKSIPGKLSKLTERQINMYNAILFNESGGGCECWRLVRLMEANNWGDLKEDVDVLINRGLVYQPEMNLIATR